MQLISRKERSAMQANLPKSLRDYTRALRQGDGVAADRVIEALPIKALSLGEIYLGLLTPALTAIGDSWCVGEIGVGQEHLATQLVLGQLDRLRGIFGAPERRSSYRVMVSCVEREQHTIGARMFADLCLAQGWVVDFLGADIPGAALLDMIESRHPQILALSLTMERGVDTARDFLRELAQLAAPPKVILGGQAAVAAKLLVPENSRDSVVTSDVVEGINSAAAWQRIDRPRTILKEYLQVLGQRVRELRTKKGWTQEQLAQATRVTRVCIVAVEGGKQNVSMDIVVRMANALGIRPEALLTEHEESLHSGRREA
jgi:methanogenic corrinoid protein MtbC1/DNA-binding XRE family transcriptional regulator